MLANHGFSRVGGTEAYLVTLAEQLQRLGHDLTVYAHELGPFSDHARGRGVDVRGALGELPGDCDMVFAQDAVVAYELAERYPDAPLVFRACSDVYDFELPPQLSGIVDRIVVLSDRYARLVEACGVTAPVIRLRYPVDVARIAPPGAIRDRPRRAVVLGNYDERVESVREAWGPEGVEVEQVGGARPRFGLAEALAGADIVVAKSRAAVEAMGAARAVYVFDWFGGDGWVTPESYPALEADNFAGQATDRVIDVAALRRDLAGYDPGMGAVNRDLVKQHHGARDHAIELLGRLDGLKPGERPRAALPELARLTALQWAWERLARERQRDLGELHARVVGQEAAVAQLREEAALAGAATERAEAAAATAATRAEATAARAAEAERRAAEAEGRAVAAEDALRARHLHEARFGDPAELRAQLDEVRSTRVWRAATGFWRLKDRLRPGRP